jgi:enoyl-CoA hydratase/carnithine racemase
MKYDLPDVLDVEADGPVRIVRLSRPEQLNAINDELHLGLTRLFLQLTADTEARAAVITGAGRAFSAGGDFDLLDRMAKDRMLRHDGSPKDASSSSTWCGVASPSSPQ